jgi:hypothetical protein
MAEGVAPVEMSKKRKGLLGFYIAAVILVLLAVAVGFMWVPLRERRSKKRTVELFIRNLDKRVNADFKDKPAGEALNYFFGLLNCGVITDPNSKVKWDARVSLQFENVPFAAVLDSWCAQVGADWTIADSGLGKAGPYRFPAYKLIVTDPQRVAEMERADPYVARLVREYREQLTKNWGRTKHGTGKE